MKNVLGVLWFPLVLLVVAMLAALPESWAEGSSPSRSTPAVTPTPFGGGSGQIAFVSDRDGDREIFLMNSDGSNVVQLTHNEADDVFPVWSPDGSRIAFLRVSERDGSRFICVMNADGSEPLQLTSRRFDLRHYRWRLSWSPDSTRIAFHAKLDGNYWEIFVAPVDGSGIVRLTDNDYSDAWPTWSADGRRIAFGSNRDGDYELYVMNADGTDVVRLTDNSFYDGFPLWSPDGRHIAFASTSGRGFFDIFVMDADGSNIIHASLHSDMEFPFAWSPDSTRVAYEFVPIPVLDLFPMIRTVYVDGTGDTFPDEYFTQHPTWSPDSSYVAFTSTHFGNFDIYVNDNGGDSVRLTDHPAADFDPAWRP